MRLPRCTRPPRIINTLQRIYLFIEPVLNRLSANRQQKRRMIMKPHKLGRSIRRETISRGDARERSQDIGLNLVVREIVRAAVVRNVQAWQPRGAELVDAGEGRNT